MNAMHARTASRTAIVLTVFVAGLAATHPAMAQALEPVVRGATIARDTVVAITLLLMTVGVGMAGYKIMFAGASPRRVQPAVRRRHRRRCRRDRRSLHGLTDRPKT
jgi:uncharacterized membrane protein YidH (DUF202 family)